jgi:hypothetical protein
MKPKHGASLGRKPAARRKGRKAGLWHALRQMLTLTFFGRLALLLAAGGVVLIVDLLAVSFGFEAFFKLAGIEMILAGVGVWIRFLIRTRPAATRTQRTFADIKK